MNSSCQLANKIICYGKEILTGLWKELVFLRVTTVDLVFAEGSATVSTCGTGVSLIGCTDELWDRGLDGDNWFGVVVSDRGLATDEVSCLLVRSKSLNGCVGELLVVLGAW